MPINITMPALSPTMEEGNLAKWLVKEGDKVAPGDVIAEIETDKATMEVEAVDEGTVAKLVVPAGTEGVKVNSLIAVLAADGEDVAAAAKGGGDEEPGDLASARLSGTHQPLRHETGDIGGRNEADEITRRRRDENAESAATARQHRQADGRQQQEQKNGQRPAFRAEDDARQHDAEGLRMDRHGDKAELYRRDHAENDDDRGKQGGQHQIACLHSNLLMSTMLSLFRKRMALWLPEAARVNGCGNAVGVPKRQDDERHERGKRPGPDAARRLRL